MTKISWLFNTIYCKDIKLFFPALLSMIYEFFEQDLITIYEIHNYSTVLTPKLSFPVNNGTKLFVIKNIYFAFSKAL